jgi:hypothetical protein
MRYERRYGYSESANPQVRFFDSIVYHACHACDVAESIVEMELIMHLGGVHARRSEYRNWCQARYSGKPLSIGGSDAKSKDERDTNCCRHQHKGSNLCADSRDSLCSMHFVSDASSV